MKDVKSELQAVRLGESKGERGKHGKKKVDSGEDETQKQKKR